MGQLDGSELRRLPGDLAIVTPAAGGRLVAMVAGNPGRLIVIEPDGLRRRLSVPDPDRWFIVDRAGETAYAVQTRLTHGRVTRIRAHLWKVPLDGSAPTRILTRLGGARHVAVSPDGSTVAVDWVTGDEWRGWLVAKAPGRPAVRTRDVTLIGIDAAGQVIGADNGGYLRIDPRTGQRGRLPQGGPPYAERDVVTPSGRHLVSFGDPSRYPASTEVLTVRDLVDGSIRSWDLPAVVTGDWPDEWQLTDLGGDRYAVLGLLDDDRFTMTEWAIVDLEEGWLGFIGFCPPLASRVPVASPAP